MILNRNYFFQKSKMNISGKSAEDSHADRLSESFSSRGTFQVVLESLIYSLICSTSFVGNLLVLYIVYKSVRLKNVPGMLIASLALSDVAIISFTTSPSLLSLIHGRWTSGFATCQFQGYVVITTTAASLQTMALMSLDRYYRVVRPMKHRTLFSMPRARLMAAAVWFLAMMYPVPYLVSGRKYIFHPGKFFCFHEAKMSFVSDFVYICLFISISVILFCYFNIFRQLRANANRIQSWRAHDNSISSDDAKLTKTLFATVLAYVFCWTPVLIIDFVEMGVGKWSLPRVVYVMYTDMGLTSSSVNPIIYGALNRTFRQEYKKIFCFRKLLSHNINRSDISKGRETKSCTLADKTVN